MNTSTILAAFLALAGLPSGGDEPARILDVRAVDLDGRVHRLGTEPELGPVALVLLDVGCPASRRYAPRLNELARLAAARGVDFFGVLSDPELGVAAARAFRTEYALEFPVLFDSAGDLAARLAPTTVPEAFVIDRADRLAYRGRIDDRFVEPGRLRPTVTAEELLAALEAVAEGKRPSVAFAQPVGCVFEAWSAGSARATVTWGRDVAPILAANCVECHRPGDIGPFSLLGYEDARRRAQMIAQVVEQRLMPPWHAESGFGDFQSARSLSPRQIGVLRAWAEAGAPRAREGEEEGADELPPPPTPTTRWRLGEPDLLVSMPVDYPVEAAGDDVYRYFVVPSALTEARDMVAVDFRPGDPSVVHHCIAYLDPSGRARAFDAEDEEPGFSVFGRDAGFLQQHAFAGWAPGAQPYVYPPGLGEAVPPGGDFVLEVHYHKNGKATTDRSALALYFAKEPVERHVEGLVMGTEQIDIPAGEGRYTRHVYMDVPKDLELIDLTPHMHFLGRDVEAVASLPDGGEVPLIRIPRWDFRWQDTYVYREPLFLPEGSRLDVRFTFDNSAENPFNPSSPPIRVQEGWRTTDEMCLFYFTVVPGEPRDAQAIERAALSSFLRPPE
jgi:AhpC/TSA family protein